MIHVAQAAKPSVTTLAAPPPAAKRLRPASRRDALRCISRSRLLVCRSARGGHTEACAAVAVDPHRGRRGGGPSPFEDDRRHGRRDPRRAGPWASLTFGAVAQAVQRNHDGETDGHLGGSDGHRKEDENLSTRGRCMDAGERHQHEVGGVEHDLDRQQHQQDVAPAGDPDTDRRRRAPAPRRSATRSAPWHRPGASQRSPGGRSCEPPLREDDRAQDGAEQQEAGHLEGQQPAREQLLCNGASHRHPA